MFRTTKPLPSDDWPAPSHNVNSVRSSHLSGYTTAPQPRHAHAISHVEISAEYARVVFHPLTTSPFHIPCTATLLTCSSSQNRRQPSDAQPCVTAATNRDKTRSMNPERKHSSSAFPDKPTTTALLSLVCSEGGLPCQYHKGWPSLWHWHKMSNARLM